MTIEAITIDDYTTTELAGTGTFDVLMRAVKTHIKQEYDQNRIKGADYSTVYLGALNSVMAQSLQFLMAKDKAYLDAKMIEVEIEKLEIEKTKAVNEAALIAAQTIKINAEVRLVDAQVLIATASLAETQAKTALLVQQKLNAVLEQEVMDATVCKLKAEFDVLVETRLKTVSETLLLNQKKVTEVAQTNGAGVTADSAVGRQNALYAAQATGFARDAEQKAVGLILDTWNVRRTTDETGTSGNAANHLQDSDVGKMVVKLMAGIGVS